MFASIIIDISHEKLDRTFQYAIPAGLEREVLPGVEVIIPFGKGNRLIRGYVMEVSDRAEFDVSKIKPVHALAENSLAIESQLIALAGWMKEQYGGTMIQALKTVIPVKQKIKAREKKRLTLLLSREQAEKQLAIFVKKHYKARERLLKELIQNKTLDYDLVTGKLNITAAVIKAFKEQGIISIETNRQYRNPLNLSGTTRGPAVLREEQQYAVDKIMEPWHRGEYETSLIHGITGSGKTEVYMALIKQVVEAGKQAIVLIPEISLTYQTVMRFYAQFGDRVSIINSRLSTGERHDQFERAKKGGLDVMIGPRSALFTPFERLGMILIDEEHEGTYKSETVPKYHARETAIQRAKMAGASVVLGSATPSIEAYYRAEAGEYRLFTLNRRHDESRLPAVYTVDLREELKSGNRSILSRQLSGLIEDRLAKKQQIMLFINRRGYAGFVSCRACGYVVKCPHCDISLSAHNNGRLVCHYCGFEQPGLTSCPSCGSRYIGGFRAGTQQIEEVVRAAYPGAGILRMDMDTTRSKDGHASILSAFAGGEADILVGTQMIVKGHDFPNVTLVGILAADLSLYANDYHAPERTFQLLTQAAGRAGRGKEAGEVVIQTYSPKHYSVKAAQSQDYEAFYRQEIAYRMLAGYPPVSHLLAVLSASEQEERAMEAALLLSGEAKALADGKAAVIGPGDCSVAKVRDVYKKILYIKHSDYEKLVFIKNRLEAFVKQHEKLNTVSIQFDFNPMNTY